MPRIVLTGGPCGGKTTLMQELRAADAGAERWLLTPEIAPVLFYAGLDPRPERFEPAVAQLQMAMEDACARAARPAQVMLCHRGSLDPLAYWRRAGSGDESRFFELTGSSRDDHLRRYDGVLHMQTTAIGAAWDYRSWPEGPRIETPEEAARIDELCLAVWGGHPRRVVAPAQPDWPGKASVARDALHGLLDQIRAASRSGDGTGTPGSG